MTLHQTPQAITSKVRFEHIRNTLIRDPGYPRTTLAAESGYADQAHMARDFKHFTDMSPSAFAKQIKEMDFAHEPGVAFLQAEE
jgi:AraC-like DNA-binding protein